MQMIEPGWWSIDETDQDGRFTSVLEVVATDGVVIRVRRPSWSAAGSAERLINTHSPTFHGAWRVEELRQPHLVIEGPGGEQQIMMVG